MYPVLISFLGIAVSILTLILRTMIYGVRDECHRVQKKAN